MFPHSPNHLVHKNREAAPTHEEQREIKQISFYSVLKLSAGFAKAAFVE
jgi:hypothetical protein